MNTPNESADDLPAEHPLAQGVFPVRSLTGDEVRALAYGATGITPEPSGLR